MGENILLIIFAALSSALIAGFAVWIALRKAASGALTRENEGKERIAGLTAENQSLQDEIRKLEQNIAEFSEKHDELINQKTSLKEQLARLESDLKNQIELNKEKLATFREAEERMREAFKAMSAEALKSNNESFLELAKSSLGKFQELAKEDLTTRQKQIGEIVKPIKESLEKVDAKINDVEKNRREAYGAIIKQVETMMTSQKELAAQTGNLVTALRAPNVRGRWGEIQLRRVVELAGMLNHCDFEEQSSLNTEDGRLRPDMVVHLPGGKNVIVDAKTPLAAYIEAMEAKTEEEKELKLKTHARQVKDHITSLSRKSYWDQFDSAPEFVVMFLPGETFFSAALQHDPTLIEYGVEQKVIPASPTTLIALLRAVAYGWQQERIAENAQAISDLGKELYERLSTVSAHFVTLGKSLDRSVDSYNKAIRSLESRVMVTARKFPELGTVSKSEINELNQIESASIQIQADEINGNNSSEEN